MLERYSQRLFFVFIFLCFMFCGCYAKTYTITGPMDLKGRELFINNRTKLVFKNSGCIINGVVHCNNAKIVVKTSTPIFENVRLCGNFLNKESYLSWWKTGDDVSDAIESLANCFRGTIHIDKPGKLKRRISFNGGKELEIDGGNNTIQLEGIFGTAFQIDGIKRVYLHDLTLSYKGLNPGVASHNGAICVSHIDGSLVRLNDLAIEGFENIHNVPCGFDAIMVQNAVMGTITEIHSVSINNNVVKGDCIESNGKGANYAITIVCNQQVSGKVRVVDCHFSNIFNVDELGNKIYEDTSGIYLAGAIGKDSEGKIHYANWDAVISECHFKDVSKRNVKIQGNYVILRNLYSETTSDFLKTIQNMYVGIEGSNITVDGIYGQYDGAIVKITGDYLTLRDMHCTSSLRDSDHAHVIRLEGTLHATIEDCLFDNNTYIFLFPKENGFSSETVPEYHINKCDLNIKHLIYCISGYPIIYYKGKLFVNNSKLRLSDTFCFNSKSLAAIVLTNTFVECNDSLYHKKEDGTPIITMKKTIIQKCLN